MNRIILTLVIGFFSTFLSAQTKFISHKSHSGKANSFSINADGNLGWNPSMEHYNYDTMLKMDSIQNALIHKNNQQKLDSIQKDSIKKDKIIRIPRPKMTPKNTPQKNPKSEMINPQNEVNQISVNSTGNKLQNISKNWFWIFALILPIGYFFFKKL